MQAEDAGMEVMSGCLGLLALLFAAGGGALWSAFWKRRVKPAYDQLIRLMIDFVFGVDRSQVRVTQIHTLLLNHFLHDSRYEELMTSVASFVPGGTAPFLDEAGLVKVFQAFLKSHKVTGPEEAPGRSSVWPPPPKR